MSKRNKLILFGVGLVLLIVLIFVATHQKEEITEYDFQELYLDKADVVDFNEAKDLFYQRTIMNYDEYVQFCVEWNLPQTYTNEKKMYAVAANMYDGVRSADIDEIQRVGKRVNVYGLCYGAVNTEYITIDFVVIPVKNNVKEIMYMEKID